MLELGDVKLGDVKLVELGDVNFNSAFSYDCEFKY